MEEDQHKLDMEQEGNVLPSGRGDKIDHRHRLEEVAPLRVHILVVVDRPSRALTLHDPDILLEAGHFHKEVVVMALDRSTVVD